VAFAVVYDACVLYPSIVRDVLIRVAIEGTVRAHWSDRILDEVFRNLKKNRPDLDPAKLDRTRSLMEDAIEDANVTGYESIIDGLVLPDPDDRHVLAAAIRAGAQVIVTDNLKHCPAAALDPFGISAKGSDDFLVDQYLPQ
jgi:predicted nucleic acid-binding protein